MSSTFDPNTDSRVDSALDSPPFITSPGNEFHAKHRKFQGIPGIERTRRGRLLAIWYSGGDREGPENHVVMVRSDDDGVTWTEPLLVVDPLGEVRAFDPVLWNDPRGRLWMFWAQSYQNWDGRSGTWVSRCDDPDADRPAWTQPRRIADGIMMNKPTVRHDGAWLLPTAVWTGEPLRDDMAEQRFSNVVASTDDGQTFTRLGRADVPGRVADEHMLIERADRSLWMLVRTDYGIGQSVSANGGVTWTPGENSGIPGPGSRFFVRRLNSGKLMLVNHHDFTGRNNLTAMLSDDDGATWYGRLLLDERSKVSYPDGVEAEDGRIFVIYDHDRTGEMDIRMAVFTESDIAAGECTSDAARMKVLICKGGR